jgi:hypothetical protein
MAKYSCILAIAIIKLIFFFFFFYKFVLSFPVLKSLTQLNLPWVANSYSSGQIPYVRFEVFTVVSSMLMVFWGVTVYSLIDKESGFSKTLVLVYQTTQCHIPEHCSLEEIPCLYELQRIIAVFIKAHCLTLSQTSPIQIILILSSSLYISLSNMSSHEISQPKLYMYF